MDDFFPDYPFREDFEMEKIQLDCNDIYPVRAKKAGAPYTDECDLVLKEGDEATVDFSKEVVGVLTLTANGHGRLRIIYGEHLPELYYDTAEPEVDWYYLPMDTFDADGDTAIVSRGRRAFRYIRIVSEDFCGRIENTVMKNESYPVKDKGYFFCSDEKLNRIWELCENTTRLCMHQFYEDGIKRDGLLWLGDCHVQERCGAVLYGDSELLARSLKYFAMSMRKDGRLPSNATVGGAHQHPARIRYMFRGRDVEGDAPTREILAGVGCIFYASYSMDFTDMVWEYYVQTGDMELVRTLFPYVRMNMEYLCDVVGTDIKKYLLPVSRRCLEWLTYIDVLSEPAAGYAKMLYTLNNYENICALIGEECENMPKWREIFKGEISKCMREGRLYDREGADTLSPTAQAFYYLCGGFDKDKAREAFTFMQTYPKARKNLDGFAKYWYMLAKAECGMLKEILSEIKHEYTQMLDTGATTCWEKFDGDHPELFITERTGSRCHGWSAGPADIFARCVLGVRWDRATNTLSVTPDLGGLCFAEGAVMTPIGKVSVRITRESTDITLPEGNYTLVTAEGQSPRIKYI